MSMSLSRLNPAALKQLLEQHQDNLSKLELQSAKYGVLGVPLWLVNEIRDTNHSIDAIIAEFARRETDDPQGAPPETPRVTHPPIQQGSQPFRKLYLRWDKDASGDYIVTIEGEGAAAPRTMAIVKNDVDTTYQDIKDLHRQFTQAVARFYDMTETEDEAKFEPKKLHEIGTKLANWLPEAGIKLIQQYVLQAKHDAIGLTIFLDVSQNSRELLQLPWELLRVPLDELDTTQQKFLFLNQDIILVRQVPYTQTSSSAASLPPRLPKASHHPLSVSPESLQVIAASPAQTPIDLRMFLSYLRNVPGLDAATPPARVLDPSFMRSWWYAGNNTRKYLLDRLDLHNPHILQLVCHGIRPHTMTHANPPELLFLSHNGTVETIALQDDLWTQLHERAPNLQLVVLSACKSSGDEHSDLAQILVRSGIPMVISAQDFIDQESAALFASTLYQHLQQGEGLEHALWCARFAIYDREKLDWALPVIYQRRAGLL